MIDTDTNDNYDDDEEFVISKSQIKREMNALQDLGKALVKLTPNQLKKMPGSEDLLTSVLEAKKYKMKALKRQLQRIGVLMRSEDAEAIQKALDRLHKPEKQQVKEFHKIEKWRDDLIAGEADVMKDIVEQFPEIDHQYMNQMIRNAKKEKANNKPPKSAKALFQYLDELNDSNR